MSRRKKVRPEIVSAVYDFDVTRAETWTQERLAALNDATPDEFALASDMHYMDAEWYGRSRFIDAENEDVALDIARDLMIGSDGWRELTTR